MELRETMEGVPEPSVEMRWSLSPQAVMRGAMKRRYDERDRETCVLCLAELYDRRHKLIL
jgi:hypothetical protein